MSCFVGKLNLRGLMPSSHTGQSQLDDDRGERARADFGGERCFAGLRAFGRRASACSFAKSIRSINSRFRPPTLSPNERNRALRSLTVSFSRSADDMFLFAF